MGSKYNLKNPKYHAVILLGLAFLLRLCNIGKDFSGDENLLIGMARLNFSQMLSELIHKDAYPPLTYAILNFWLRLDSSIVWARAYFLLFGLGVCIVIYMLAREYLGDKYARLSLSLACVSPLLIFASQYTRSYIDSSFWMLVSSFCILKIIKTPSGWPYWAAYAVSAALSLYTFYFSALLLCAHFLFLAIFKRDNKKLILQWLISAVCAGILYLPWVPSALRQFDNMTYFHYNWKALGYSLGSLRVGLFTRNLFSLFGLDPYFFIFQGGVAAHFGAAALLFIAVASFTAAVLFLRACLIYLKRKFDDDKALAWFPFCITFLPLLIFWIIAMTMHVLPNARYLVCLHASFLLLLSAYLFSLMEAKKTRWAGIILLAATLLVFIVRIPAAVSSEFEHAKAQAFLLKEAGQDDRIVCVSYCPAQVNTRTMVKVAPYLKLNDEKNKYYIPDEPSRMALNESLGACRVVWFYRVYGNMELFGANGLCDDWLKERGYRYVKAAQFKNVTVVKYAR